MKKSAKKNKMTIKNKKRFCIMIFIIIAIILMALIINGIFGNKYGNAGSVKDGVVTY